jgi:sugar/nucleoside kinase (ribokinase family)
VTVQPLVCTLGDLVEDVIVRSAGPMVRAADVEATVSRHRGGSAANTAAAVARAGGRARFVGRVGDDEVGHRLVSELRALGVDCPAPTGGRTGTVVVVVEPDGERTMFSDRRSAADLDHADEAWLDGAAVLHVPAYAFTEEPLASVATLLLRSARARVIMTSMDASTPHLLDARFGRLLGELRPDVLLCNQDEAARMRVPDHGHPDVALVVVKQGPRPVLLRGTVNADVPTRPVEGLVDTTGAGDAFAAGFLLALARGTEPTDAARAGQRTAAAVVRGPGADAWEAGA